MAKKDKDAPVEKFEFGADVEDAVDEAEVTADVVEGDISGELTEAEKRKLEAEARSEIAKSFKLAKMKDFKAAAKKRLQAEIMFRQGMDDTGEDLATIDLVLASYPKYIILDGAVYHSGRKYTKRRGIISVLADQMDRGWRQEAARMGERTEWVEQKQKLLTRQGLQVH